MATINDNNSTSDNQSCFKISDGNYKVRVAATAVLDSLVCLACITAIVIVIFLKAYKRFLTRLMLYPVIVTFCYAINDAFTLLAFESSPEDQILRVADKSWCIGAAFLRQFLNWMLLLVLLCLAIHLFILSEFRKNLHTCRREVCGFLTALTVSLTMSLIPLIGNLYGKTGTSGCWIKHVDNECDTIVIGYVERYILWYVPATLAFIFMVATLGVAVKALYKDSKTADPANPMSSKYQQALKETSTFFIFYFLFAALFSVVVVGHVFDTNPKTWPLDAVVEPLLLLLVPVVFILHPVTRKKLKCRELKRSAKKWRIRKTSDTIYTQFTVPAEFSEDEPLVIQGSKDGSYPGYEAVLDTLS